MPIEIANHEIEINILSQEYRHNAEQAKENASKFSLAHSKKYFLNQGYSEEQSNAFAEQIKAKALSGLISGEYRQVKNFSLYVDTLIQDQSGQPLGKHFWNQRQLDEMTEIDNNIANWHSKAEELAFKLYPTSKNIISYRLKKEFRSLELSDIEASFNWAFFKVLSAISDGRYEEHDFLGLLTVNTRWNIFSSLRGKKLQTVSLDNPLPAGASSKSEAPFLDKIFAEAQKDIEGKKSIHIIGFGLIKQDDLLFQLEVCLRKMEKRLIEKVGRESSRFRIFKELIFNPVLLPTEKKEELTDTQVDAKLGEELDDQLQTAVESNESDTLKTKKQVEIAQQLGVTPQYVHKSLHGTPNTTGTKGLYYLLRECILGSLIRES